MISPRLSLDQYRQGVLARDKMVLARAITLAESRRDDDRRLAEDLLESLQGEDRNSVRIGVTGPPGAGKSTLIEALGMHLASLGRRVAVLAVDPSSQLSKGSILGDKTRMEQLSRHPDAFVRPAPSGGHLGGSHPYSRQMITLCEAAGFDTILIETVGVGQSETEVANLADLVLLVLGPAGGDDLQGVKRGIVEIADLIAINKADGALMDSARRTQRQYGQALHLFPPKPHNQIVEVVLASALHETGIPDLWAQLDSLHQAIEANGFKMENRRRQQLAWFADALSGAWAQVLESRLGHRFRSLEQAVAEGKTWPPAAARQAVEEMLKGTNLPHS